MNDASGNSRYVLDAFALLAYFRAEPAAPRVTELLHEGDDAEFHLSVINLAEVSYQLERELGRSASEAAECAMMEELPIRLVDADIELSLRVARLKTLHPISIADCYAAALTERLDATLVTGDRDFERFEGNLRIEWLPSNR